MNTEQMTKRIFLPLLLLFIPLSPLLAQSGVVESITSTVSQSDVEMHIRFLASDEFMGRDTGTPQLKIAGRYIATWFSTNGVKPVPGQEDFYQPVPFTRIFAPDEGILVKGDSTYTLGEEILAMNNIRGEISAPITVLNYGTEEELEEADLDGKIVIIQAGLPGQSSPRQWFMSADEKNTWLRQHGAKAVIEIFDHQQFPWQTLVGFLNRDRVELSEENGDGEKIPHLWLNGTGKNLHKVYQQEEQAEEARIKISGKSAEKVVSNNVIGYIEGTDPDLKHEYLLLGAHYDHIGVVPGQDEGNYIFNGARDNAVGISGILHAARYLSENPPKRSVIVATWTAEEQGLLGSNWFSENPAIPLNQVIYHLNIDGAGYNDTTKVTVIGLERTEAEEDIRNSTEAFGLEAIPDPVPEQNLFDRSDNVNFARHGIPSPTYSLGITAFDEEINQFYHQVTDQSETLDYSYVTNYIRSFVLTSLTIANSDSAPFWKEGDFYEEAGLDLYGN